MKRFMVTDDDGVSTREIDHAWVEGYAIGDRQLEDVWFKITITPDNRFHAEVDPGSVIYFRTLNQDMWLREVLKSCAVGGEFYSDPNGEPDATCIETGEGEHSAA